MISRVLNRLEEKKMLIHEFGFYFLVIREHRKFHVNVKEIWISLVTHEKATYFYMTEFCKSVQGTLNIVLCFWERQFTLTVPFTTHMYTWVPAKLMQEGNPAMV